jgi:hypothetical protein
MGGYVEDCHVVTLCIMVVHQRYGRTYPFSGTGKPRKQQVCPNSAVSLVYDGILPWLLVQYVSWWVRWLIRGFVNWSAGLSGRWFNSVVNWLTRQVVGLSFVCLQVSQWFSESFILQFYSYRSLYNTACNKIITFSTNRSTEFIFSS